MRIGKSKNDDSTELTVLFRSNSLTEVHAKLRQFSTEDVQLFQFSKATEIFLILFLKMWFAAHLNCVKFVV